MCGIAGYSLQSPTSGVDLEKALNKLGHRGPDDSGTYVNGLVGLGQTRLSIIDLEGGHQPIISGDGPLVLVANGEIYNFVELREELRKKGCRFLTKSDSEVIIHSYAHYGDDFLRYLDGMFAFALYDKARDRMVLARDRLGIKPLFISETRDGVAFASEIKGLLPLLDSRPKINPHGLVQYLQNQFSSGGVTILEGVERVLPAEAVVIEKGKVTGRWRYWSALDVQPRKVDFPEAQAEFDPLMDTVMTQHMRSDVPFGLFLSGGADSAVLLAVLSRLKEEPVRTFSVGFPGTSLVDELPDAGAMAKMFSSRHREIVPGREEIFGILPLTVWAADDLMRDYASLPTCLLSAAASKELKVVFSGEGGDEVFAGYGRYRAPKLERWGKSLLMPGTGGFRTRGNFNPLWTGSLFGPELRRANRDFREPFIEAWSRTPRAWSDLQRMQYTDLITAIPDNLLVKADRMMMAWGLEGRVPFLDHRIVEFGLSLPDRLKVGSAQGKLFLKRWASRFIPEDHLFRRKKGFHVPVGEWLDEERIGKLREPLLRHPAVTEWFQTDGVACLIDRSLKKRPLRRLLMALIQFAVWHRIFVEGPCERPPARSDLLGYLD